MSLFETITDLADAAQRARVRARRYGVIECHAGRLVRLTLRPWPQLLAWPEVVPVGPEWRPSGPADRVRLFYNQPCRHVRFLALRYVEATAGTRYATLHAALETLDAVAALKGVDALVCDAANERLSERFLERRGWAPLARGPGRRSRVRRFYGEYPAAALTACGLAESDR